MKKKYISISSREIYRLRNLYKRLYIGFINNIPSKIEQPSDKNVLILYGSSELQSFSEQKDLREELSKIFSKMKIRLYFFSKNISKYAFGYSTFNKMIQRLQGNVFCRSIEIPIENKNSEIDHYLIKSLLQKLNSNLSAQLLKSFQFNYIIIFNQLELTLSMRYIKYTSLLNKKTTKKQQQFLLLNNIFHIYFLFNKLSRLQIQKN